jgi:hypothetical protein
MKYVRSDIKRAFDLLQICADDLQKLGFKYEQKSIPSENIWNARIKIMEAIEELAVANTIKVKPQ